MPDKKQFPISYISHCLSPRAMFASRASVYLVAKPSYYCFFERLNNDSSYVTLC